jgi:PAS domain S-box-containing protein
MPNTSFKKSLLRAMLFVAVLPLVLVAVAGWFSVEQSQTQALMRENVSYAQTVSAQIAGHLDRVDVLASAYRTNDYRQLASSALFKGLWQQRVDTIRPLESMQLLDDRGRVVVSVVASGQPAPGDLFVGLDHSRIPEFIKARKTGQSVWSGVHVSPVSGEPSIDYVFPMASGTIVLELSLADFRSTIGSGMGGMTPVIVDRNGVVLYHPDAAVRDSKPNLAGESVVRDALNGSPGVSNRFELNGKTYLAGSLPMRSTGWAVISLRPADDVKQVVQSTQLGMLLAASLAVLFALGVASVLSAALARPLGSLADAVVAVTEGDYDIPHVDYRHEEFRNLSGALEEMSAAVREREDRIQDSAKQYRLFVESLRAIPYEFDVEMNRFTYVGPRAVEILGYPFERWVNLQSWEEMIHPDDREQAVGSAVAAAAERFGDRDLSYRMIAASGEVVPIHEVVSMHKRSDGSRFLIGVLVDMTEATQVEDLKVAAEVADAASQAKSGFLAYMSHELRTPLNSIIGFSQIMLDGLAGQVSDEQRRQLGMIRRSGAHLMALVNDILDLEKIESGSIEVSTAPVDLGALVVTALDAVGPMAERKGLTVNVSVPEQTVVLKTDEDKVRQILLNLFSNAIKYTDQGGVTVTLSNSVDGTAQVLVVDTGMGIDEELLEEVFDEFRIIGRAGQASQESTGLGLTISRRLARLLGGDIAVESELGRGSVFTLTLPLGEDG